MRMTLQAHQLACSCTCAASLHAAPVMIRLYVWQHAALWSGLHLAVVLDSLLVMQHSCSEAQEPTRMLVPDSLFIMVGV